MSSLRISQQNRAINAPTTGTEAARSEHPDDGASFAVALGAAGSMPKEAATQLGGKTGDGSDGSPLSPKDDHGKIGNAATALAVQLVSPDPSSQVDKAATTLVAQFASPGASSQADNAAIVLVAQLAAPDASAGPRKGHEGHRIDANAVLIGAQDVLATAASSLVAAPPNLTDASPAQAGAATASASIGPPVIGNFSPADASTAYFLGSANGASSNAPATASTAASTVALSPAVPAAAFPGSDVARLPGQDPTAQAPTSRSNPGNATTPASGVAGPVNLPRIATVPVPGMPTASNAGWLPDIAGAAANIGGALPAPDPVSAAAASPMVTRPSTSVLAGLSPSLPSGNPSQPASGDTSIGASGSPFAADTRGRFAPAGAPSDAGNVATVFGGGSDGASLAVSPSVAPADRPDPASAAAISDQVADHLVRMVTSNSRDMVMRLHPPELGDLTVRIAVNGRDVSAWFDSPQPHVQSAISAGMGQLQTDLGNAGYNLNGAWVGGDASNSRQQGSGPPPAAAPTAAAPVGLSAAVSSRPAASGLNIYV